ncbi:MAG: hypothetical protein AMXMBFR84_04820 [Candidatus Hydrogenedentota bacterium]
MVVAVAIAAAAVATVVDVVAVEVAAAGTVAVTVAAADDASPIKSLPEGASATERLLFYNTVARDASGRR